MTDSVSIYVALPDEGVQVWRPIFAEHLGGDRYRVLEQPYDTELERWEFVPGDEVICGYVDSYDGKILAAIKRDFSGDGSDS
jgi:hypothetical protein